MPVRADPGRGRQMAPRASYNEHLDVLVALVSYLALTTRKSRTAGNLAEDLSWTRLGCELPRAVPAEQEHVIRRGALLHVARAVRAARRGRGRSRAADS